MKYITISMIKIYQTLISPLYQPCCRFYPTCSKYAIEAISQHGFYGVALSFYRIIRCNPFAKFGYDPVPNNNKRKTL